MQTHIPIGRNPMSALRQFVRKPVAPAVENCELCGLALPAEHSHLLEYEHGKLVCSCEACTILFSGQQSARFKRVPRDIEILDDFHLSDGQWDDLHLPINLAFFVERTPVQRVLAFYPSPAGAVESLLSLEAWQALVEQNPVVATFEPDVEALLVNRVNGARGYYRCPIDECFKLVGLIRIHWKGLSGGTQAWDEVARFFSSLEERSRPR
jgi:Family of unknown function (DUF5947)